MEKFEIDYPSEEEIRLQVSKIVDGALPRRRSFPQFLVGMYQELGLRVLFHDYAQLGATFALFLVYVGLSTALRYHPHVGDPTLIYSYLFIASPLLFGALSVISVVGKQETFEVEMACKYNVYQVASFRMLLFGLISILANIVQIALLFVILGNFHPATAVMVSLTSLLLFALGFLFVTNQTKSRAVQFLVVGAWVALNVGMVLWRVAVYEALLLRVPLLVYGLVVLGGCFWYVKKLKNMTKLKESGIYVNRF